MKTSLFDRIYSYRERANKDSKENFLIEIFAFSLETDKQFFTDFLGLLEIKNDKENWINTQVVYDFGRPDIEIHLKTQNVTILVECKIEHFERPNQLIDYKKILLQKETLDKHLVYLTKYYDQKELETREIFFHHKKWADIYSIVNENNLQVTTQLKQFLKEQGMAESNNFQYQDLSILNNISSTIRKMDEVLDGIKPYFEKHIGPLSKESARSTRLKDNWYVNYRNIYKQKGFQYGIGIGFFWWDEEISLALRINLPNRIKNKSTTRYKTFFDKHLKNWEVEEWDDYYNYWYYEKVAKFIIEEDEQIPAMLKFLKEGINELTALKKIDKQILSSRKPQLKPSN